MDHIACSQLVVCIFAGQLTTNVKSAMSNKAIEIRTTRMILEKRIIQTAINFRIKKQVGTELEKVAAEDELDEATLALQSFNIKNQ